MFLAVAGSDPIRSETIFDGGMMEQLSFELIDRVVFIDWHGVLSTSLFWQSILDHRPRSRFHAGMALRLEEIFDRDARIGESWMRGRFSVSDLFADVRELRGKSRNSDFLERRIIEDCLHMTVDRKLFAALGRVKQVAPVVLATDNTEDFARAFDLAKSAKSWVRWRTDAEPEVTLSRLVQHIFDIICSSRVGVLKEEDPIRFFGPWLSRHGVTFKDALLVDDRLDNLASFRIAGGSTLQWLGAERSDDIVRAMIDWAEGKRTLVETP